MKLEQHLRTNLEQRMKLTPQIIHSIEILQLPILALEERINTELMENPLLELREEDEKTETNEEPLSQESQDEKEKTLDEEMNTLTDIPEDFDEYFSQTYTPSYRRGSSDAEDKKQRAMKNIAAKPVSLEEFLINQLNLTDCDETIRAAAMKIIANIDENGYLGRPLEEIFAGDVFSPEAQQAALHVVQNLEPPGLAARDLKECLLLQLNPKDEKYAIQKLVIERYLQDVEANKYPKIAKETGVSIPDLKRAVELLGRLNPKPGRLFSNEEISFVVPDVRVEKIDSTYEIILEKSSLPSVHINSTYLKMLRNENVKPTVKEYLRQKMQSARWLIESIEQRQTTLYRISEELVKSQKEFLERGIAYLKPLRMRWIADKVGIHVSTVSRAISNKYIQTPRGIFPMKFFFTGGTVAEDGKEKSWNSLKHTIANLIEQENKKNPLSDEDIVKRMRQKGYTIARRTVAKYRKHLKIPPSHKRKEY